MPFNAWIQVEYDNPATDDEPQDIESMVYALTGWENDLDYVLEQIKQAIIFTRGDDDYQIEELGRDIEYYSEHLYGEEDQ